MKFLDRKNLNKVILGVITVVVTVIAVIGLIQAPSKSSDRLAQDLGLSKSAISMYENGNRMPNC